MNLAVRRALLGPRAGRGDLKSCTSFSYRIWVFNRFIYRRE
ncbi:hypothetical protein ABLN67_13180 [Mycobacterium tuberculosis]